jgi:Fe2+ or Zn2+ uptake regulation protein
MQIITPQIKDIVLADLLSPDSTSFTLDYSKSKEEYGVSPESVCLILNQFEELGLIKKKDFIGRRCLIHVQMKAMDLHRHGGFMAEEELLKGNIEKLGMELDLLCKQLSPNYSEKASHIASIASAVMQGLTLFK